MPFFKYDSVFPYLHECQECEAQFVSVVPDISQVFKERRKTVRAKRPVQQRKGKICAKTIVDSYAICDYCTNDSKRNVCKRCWNFDHFIGRKLSPVA